MPWRLAPPPAANSPSHPHRQTAGVWSSWPGCHRQRHPRMLLPLEKNSVKEGIYCGCLLGPQQKRRAMQSSGLLPKAQGRKEPQRAFPEDQHVIGCFGFPPRPAHMLPLPFPLPYVPSAAHQRRPRKLQVNKSNLSDIRGKAFHLCWLFP